MSGSELLLDKKYMMKRCWFIAEMKCKKTPGGTFWQKFDLTAVASSYSFEIV